MLALVAALMSRLEFAIVEAKRIRRNLQRRYVDLAGMCGVASVYLADALDDLSTLRLRCGTLFWHAYNVVDGVVIDITATQFNDAFWWPDAIRRDLRGVLVTRERQWFHTPIAGRGQRVVAFLDADYSDDRRFQRIVQRRLA